MAITSPGQKLKDQLNPDQCYLDHLGHCQGQIPGCQLVCAAQVDGESSFPTTHNYLQDGEFFVRYSK